MSLASLKVGESLHMNIAAVCDIRVNFVIRILDDKISLHLSHAVLSDRELYFELFDKDVTLDIIMNKVSELSINQYSGRFDVPARRHYMESSIAFCKRPNIELMEEPCFLCGLSTITKTKCKDPHAICVPCWSYLYVDKDGCCLCPKCRKPIC